MIGSCTLLVKKGNVYDAHIVGMLSMQFAMANQWPDRKDKKPKTQGEMIAENLPKWEKLGADAMGLSQIDHDAIHMATSTNEGSEGYHKLAGDGTYTYDPATKRLYQPKRDDKAWPYPKVQPLTLEDVTDKT